MTLNDIHDELATLRAAILESCTPWPATDYGLDPASGTVYAGEDFLVTVTPHVPKGFESLRAIPVGDLTIYSIEDEPVLNAMLTLEYHHD